MANSKNSPARPQPWTGALLCEAQPKTVLFSLKAQQRSLATPMAI
tara:strand:+ start:164 stop:298 length:135 start_codon:yes stop_codon:yes gene_type:complete